MRFLAVAAVLVVAAVGCGGGDDTASVVAELKTASSVAAEAPECDVLFANGATLPEVVPELCRRARGDLLAVVYHTCADRSRLYQVDVSAGEAWAFTGGVVTVGTDIAGDPGYKSAYDTCG